MTPKILVVEDELIIASDIQARLVRMGYDVTATVSSGEKAIEHLKVASPDLILMDLALSGALDGIETSRRIRDQSDIPIVFLTAHSDDETLRRMMVVDAHDYLRKPCTLVELKTTIERIVGVPTSP